MKTRKFTKDLIPVGKQQEKTPFTLKPRLKNALAWRNRGLKQTLLHSVKITDVIENMNELDEEDPNA